MNTVTTALFCALLFALCNSQDYVFAPLNLNTTEDYSRQYAVSGAWEDNLIIFGGLQSSGSPSLSDLVINLPNRSITEIPTQIGRVYACSSQLPGSRTLWIFGGYKGSSPVPNATALISIDLESYNTTVHAPSNSIPVVGCSCVATKDGFYVFGGRTTDTKYSSDLYKFKEGSGWTRLNSTSPSSPSARAFSSLISYTDSDGNTVLVLFGGAADVPLNDTWRFNTKTTAWSADNKFGPSPRKFHTAVFNPNHAIPQMVVFGGSGDSNIPYNDLWMYDLTGADGTGLGAWSQISVQTSWPGRRYGQTSIFHTGRMLVYSGTNGSGITDLWQFVPEVDCGTKVQCGDCFTLVGCGWCTIGRISTCVSGDPGSGVYIADTCTDGVFGATNKDACSPLPIEFDGWWVVLGVIGLVLIGGVILLAVKSLCDPCPNVEQTTGGDYERIN